MKSEGLPEISNGTPRRVVGERTHANPSLYVVCLVRYC